MSEGRALDLQGFYPDNFRIRKVIETERELTINLKSQKHQHTCPVCSMEMDRYHGTYQRKVQDLPILGKRVVLIITAFEYYCTNVNCRATTFAEDYSGFLGRSKRMTGRLEDFLVMLSLEMNCEGASAICREMGIQVSGDTLIRLLRKLADGQHLPSGDTIGVDDFAYRKGQTYCTVICDGETRRPIDLLDGRDSETLRAWLAKNKQIKKVTRDRAGAYAKAISEALPDAMHIADRFHLHQNLLKAVKEALKHELPRHILISEKNLEPIPEPGKKNTADNPDPC
jgi:transposase